MWRGKVTRRLCFALDLVDDDELIAEYERYHAPGGPWPEIMQDIRASGILEMEIWRTADRLFMILEVADDYPRPRAAEPREAAWQKMMWRFQKPLSHAAEGEKWIEMKRIFDLAEQPDASRDAELVDEE